MGTYATSPQDVPLLDVVGAKLSFGGVQALQGMDLRLTYGESAALIGPNGSGKSTLVNVITRMINLEGGAVKLGGTDVTNVKPHELIGHGVARSFQHVRLIPELTLRENVELGVAHADLKRQFGEIRTWFGLGTNRHVSAAAREALGLVEVPERVRDLLPTQVSFAMQRLTEIARALITRPRLLLLDEPVAGMNPAEVEDFRGTLRRINESGCAVLLIEHNIDFVMKAVTNITVINRGKRIAYGTVDEVRRDPRVIEAYLGVRHRVDGVGDVR
ncbi:ATP-binding cassette domain-containing protein [Paenarthrobacter sp. NPDC089316]|uniref:ABC transporter ATP-binding protein n=1 Tax=unclassified Paenarthrobacter TaxID=2634190 RepID=UPI003432E459